MSYCSLSDRCPNCDDLPAFCLCTLAEKRRALEILRQRDRKERRERGKPVLVDYSRSERP